MTDPDPPCLCGHDGYYHDGPCQVCECREYQPDEHWYPIGLGGVVVRIGSLCSGAGGLDRAVEQVFGATTAWHCETDPAASKVLAHHWPGVPNHGDLTAVDWGAVEPVDVIAAGFPCQDVSAAGKRAGLKRGTRTGVWHSIVTAIEALRPQVAVLENVLGLLTADGDEWPDSVHALWAEVERWRRIDDLIDAKMRKAQRKGNRDKAWWHRKHAEGNRASRRIRVAMAEFSRERYRLVPRAIATVLGLLAEIGYDASWTCLRASDVGACHKRERVFILATPADPGGDGRGRYPQRDGQPIRPELKAPQRDDTDGRPPPDSPRDGRHEGRPEPARFVGGLDAAVGGAGPVNLLPTPTASDTSKHSGQPLWKRAGHALRLTDVAEHALLPTPSAADGSGGRTPAQSGGMRPSGAKRSVPLTDLPLLLPTPTSRDHKGRNQRDDDTCLTGALLPTPRKSDGDGGANPLRRKERMDDVETRVIRCDGQWGKYSSAIQRWESLTRPAPPPTEPNRNGKPRLNPAFSEWMMDWPAGWVTEVPGISRNDQLRIIGNGVVVRQAVAALRWLLSVDCAVAS